MSDPRDGGERPAAPSDGAQSARIAALAAFAAAGAAPPPEVRYASSGAVLVAGPAVRALPVVAGLVTTRGLRIVAVLEGLTGRTDLPRRVAAVRGRVTRVTGYLGRFCAEASRRAGPLDLGPLSPNRDGHFDIVVDLCEQPLSAAEVTPIGYFRPGDADDVGFLADAIAALSGETTKPQFVRYDESLCAHGAQGLTGCTRCLDACPAGAVASAGSRIALDTGLCRGCGSCTAACPTGALSFTHPRPEDLRARLRHMLEVFAAAGGERPRLLIHGADASARATVLRAMQNDPDLVPIEVPTVASVGPEAWLAALAMGAIEVMVLETDDNPATTRRVVAQEINAARAVLRVLGVDTDRLRLVSADLVPGGGSQRAGSGSDGLGAHSFSVDGAKRDILERAIATLSEGPASGARRTALPAGSPFGEVRVDASTCTLCLACPRVCPTGALAGDAASGSLHFAESACVQCGLCVAACPEDAIVLVPSLEPDTTARTKARIVHHVEIAPCARCGEPFLPRVLLESSLARIGGPVPGNAEVASMLEVCPRCRSASAMREPFIGGKGDLH